MNIKLAHIILYFFVLIPCDFVCADSFVAYSFRESEKELKNNIKASGNVKNLGGITKLAAIVYDKKNKDFIIVGQVNSTLPPISIDDFVVALRSVMVHDELPLVSIEKTKDSKKTGFQDVLFGGHIENTRYGHDLLEADVILKKAALQLLPTEIWGLESYFQRITRKIENKMSKDLIGSRFWFDLVGEPGIAAKHDVVAIRNVKIGVKAEVMYASINGKMMDDPSLFQDDEGTAFSNDFSREYQNLSVIYPQVGRVKTLLDLIALASGIKKLHLAQKLSELNYWLSDYKIHSHSTLSQYPLLKQSKKIKDLEDREVNIELNGGIRLSAQVHRLRKGSTRALKKIVLNSRPKQSSLAWQVPLDGWVIPDALSIRQSNVPPPDTLKAKGSEKSIKEGTFIEVQIYREGVPPLEYNQTVPLPYRKAPDFTIYENLIPSSISTKAGGVLLSGIAKVSGNKKAQVDFSKGNFSLVIEGKNAYLSPLTFRKFVTALWSVYFEKQDPGISIDPISPDVDKHLVRYIGKVINTDLGRVMRVADYVMKKWVVGTERPNVKGFKDWDDLIAKYGDYHIGASRRFWFVPENMSFKRSDDMLLFDEGDMTLKTEFMVQNKATPSSPADLAFAQFFTKYYSDIAKENVIFEELVEYAKMVALAKYLKQKGVPLLWFLLANKDLVITEDSPGTVDELARGSRHFKGIEIKGGVKLGQGSNYVYDKEAMLALQKARKKALQSGQNSQQQQKQPTVRTAPKRVSFSAGKTNYTVSPQHTLTSGKDRRGIRYQTDIAVRQEGEPGLEVVRYFDPDRRDEVGEFGKGWHLLIPYRLKSIGERSRKFQGVLIPEKIVVESLLSGKQEELSFSLDRYSVVGYVPNKLAKSQLVGVFLLNNGSFRLSDKLGNEFWFDQAGRLTDMLFSKNYHIHYEYLRGSISGLEQPPFRLQPVDAVRIPFLNAMISKEIKVVDLEQGKTEILQFVEKGRIAGYVPKHAPWSRFRIMRLMTDGSFRLVDKQGQQIVFDANYEFKKILVTGDHSLVESVTLGEQKLHFSYGYGLDSGLRVKSTAFLKGNSNSPSLIANYKYDDSSKLAKVTH